MAYLIFASAEAADARSAEAYAPLRAQGTTTAQLWSAWPHPDDGRAALVIPATPLAAGIDMAQQDYDALLSANEQAALIPALPEDWLPGI